MYRDITEFRKKNPTKAAMLRAFRWMPEREARRLFATCGIVQAKIFYSKMFRLSKRLPLPFAPPAAGKLLQ